MSSLSSCNHDDDHDHPPPNKFIMNRTEHDHYYVTSLSLFLLDLLSFFKENLMDPMICDEASYYPALCAFLFCFVGYFYAAAQYIIGDHQGGRWQ